MNQGTVAQYVVDAIAAGYLLRDAALLLTGRWRISTGTPPKPPPPGLGRGARHASLAEIFTPLEEPGLAYPVRKPSMRDVPQPRTEEGQP